MHEERKLIQQILAKVGTFDDRLEIRELLIKVLAALTRIEDRLDGMTAAEAAEVAARINAGADKLDGVSKEPPK